MDNQIAPTVKLLSQLRALSEAAHFFLDVQNRHQTWQGWTFESTKVYLQTVVFDLGLLETEDAAEFDFAKFLKSVDQFLASASEDLIESVVPTQVLEYLEEALDEKKIQDEKFLKLIQERNTAREALLKKQLKIQQVLNDFLQKPPLTQEEIWAVTPQIAEKLQPEMATLADQAQRAKTNDRLMAEIQERGQRIYERVIQSEILSSEAKDFLITRQLSAETIKEMATTKEVAQISVALRNAVAPLTSPEIELIATEITPVIAANTAFLSSRTTPEEIGQLVATVMGQESSKFIQGGMSPDRLLNALQDLTRETQKLVVENPPAEPEFFPISPLIFYKGHVSVSFTAPKVPGNPKGKVQKLTGVLSSQAFLSGLKEGRIFNTSSLALLQLSISGVSSDELSKSALLERRKGTVESIQRAHKIDSLSNQLKLFHQQYFLNSPLPQQWIINRVEVFRTFPQISTPIKIITQKIRNWFVQTGLGKTVKSISSQVAQKSLQAVWNTAKTGITKGVTAILMKIGLQSVATAVAPVIGNLIVAVVPKLFKLGSSLLKKSVGWIISGFGIFDSLLGGISGQRSVEEDKSMVWLFRALLIIFVGIFVGLPLITFFAGPLTTGGALVGTGAGLEEIGSPTFPDIQCNLPDHPGEERHLGETVVCQLTQRPSPCNQNPIRRSNWPVVDQCFQSPETNFQGKEGIRQRFKAMVDSENCNYHVQCLGFVLAIQNARGENLDMRFGYAGAWAIPPYHPNYQAVTAPKMGDIVVWAGSPGHIAIFLGAAPDSSSKMVVVEANYDSAGSIAVRTRSNISGGGGPTVFLRFCPAKNCK